MRNILHYSSDDRIDSNVEVADSENLQEKKTDLRRLGSNPGKFKRLVARHLGKNAADKIDQTDGAKLMAIAKKSNNTSLYRQGSFIRNFYNKSSNTDRITEAVPVLAAVPALATGVARALPNITRFMSRSPSRQTTNATRNMRRPQRRGSGIDVDIDAPNTGNVDAPSISMPQVALPTPNPVQNITAQKPKIAPDAPPSIHNKFKAQWLARLSHTRKTEMRSEGYQEGTKALVIAYQRDTPGQENANLGYDINVKPTTPTQKVELKRRQALKRFRTYFGESDNPNEELLEEETTHLGKKVTLNKPFRTPSGPKKFSVYVRNERGNVVKVNFGDPNLSIKRDQPNRKKSFRARHNCSSPGPRTSARYWSCRMWSNTPVSDIA